MKTIFALIIALLILFALILNFFFDSAVSVASAQTVTTNTVDLLWEGETSIPTFYAGRPRPSAGNLVRVVAIPNVAQNGRRLETPSLVFRWVKDRNPIQSASGKGRDLLEYRADQGGGSSIVSVEVLTNQDERLAEARVTITPTKPKLVLSRVAPLTSPDRARSLMGITPISSTETTLVAQPFGFSLLDLANRRVAFDWRINGERTGAQREDPRFFTVVAPNQGTGEVKLSVTARSEVALRQMASREITLSFGPQELNF